MEIHGEVGIFQQISGENQDHTLFRLNEPLLQQFLQSSQSDSRCGLTSNALSADLSLGLRNLNFTDLLTCPACRSKNLNRFLPGRWIADANRGSPGLSLKR